MKTYRRALAGDYWKGTLLLNLIAISSNQGYLRQLYWLLEWCLI
jgi:hypothetical protein